MSFVLTERPSFPTVIDNTQRSSFLTCPTKWYLSFCRHLAPKTPSIHLHAGGAFAHGLEHARREFYETGKSVDEAMSIGLQRMIQFYGPIQAPETKTGDKSLENCIRAYDSYMQRYPLGKDAITPFMVCGKAMVEFGFSMPTQIKHPETGDPILYGGRSDMIGVMNDALWVTDEKTAGSLGEQWHKNWTLDSQFTGYVAAARSYGYPVAGALIRGVGLLKTKITHAEAIISRSDWEIERWWSQLHIDIKRMVQSWKDNQFSMALDKSSCNAYGGCEFLMMCNSQDPESYVPIYYRTRVWNPLEKDSGEKLLDQPDLEESYTPPDLHIPGLA